MLEICCFLCCEVLCKVKTLNWNMTSHHYIQTNAPLTLTSHTCPHAALHTCTVSAKIKVRYTSWEWGGWIPEAGGTHRLGRHGECPGKGPQRSLQHGLHSADRLSCVDAPDGEWYTLIPCDTEVLMHRSVAASLPLCTPPLCFLHQVGMTDGNKVRLHTKPEAH